jgi:hypothetical protein
MNAADLARLELAKRAYRATEPTATEVQRGVRRARLGLRRPKERRRWFSKGLVMVVLAVGGLAYAKPQAMGELVSNVLQASSPREKPAGRGGSALALVPPEAPRQATVAPTLAAPAPTGAPASEGTLAPQAPEKLEALQAKPAPRALALALAPASAASAASPSAPHATGSPTARESSLADAASVSDWGRVGQALARGDEDKALAALSELSESADQRTRDKADLGRAQLLMANGNRDSACAIARSLTNRRAGSRIERQAQALLKSCAR